MERAKRHRDLAAGASACSACAPGTYSSGLRPDSFCADCAGVCCCGSVRLRLGVSKLERARYWYALCRARERVHTLSILSSEGGREHPGARDESTGGTT